MIISTFTGKKRTANQMAKEIIADGIDQKLDTWGDTVDRSKLTDREVEALGEAMHKKATAIFKYLGLPY